MFHKREKNGNENTGNETNVGNTCTAKKVTGIKGRSKDTGTEKRKKNRERNEGRKEERERTRERE